MCDTLIALPRLTESGKTIFAKNSDREPNEAQAIIQYKRTQHDQSTVTCTHITIPQVKETFEVLLSKPFWSWGAEMGVNEYGVILGSSVVFSKMPIAGDNKSLTGGDLVRLGLERSKSAVQALSVITELLTAYGGDGCIGYENKKFFAHHSFIVADREEAWILETAGKEWVAQKVKDCVTISNGLTIGSEYDLISPSAIETARKNKWISGHEFNFAQAFAKAEMDTITACRVRQQVTQRGINRKKQFDLRDAFSILTAHQQEKFKTKKSTAEDVCMHATPSGGHQTVNTMIILVDGFSRPEIWTTGSSHPCLSFFKPITLGTDIDYLNVPQAHADNSFWWTIEQLHRLSHHDYEAVSEYVHENIRPYFEDLTDYGNNITPEITQKAFAFHRKAAEEGVRHLRDRIKKRFFLSPYANYWKQQNKRVGIDI